MEVRPGTELAMSVGSSLAPCARTFQAKTDVQTVSRHGGWIVKSGRDQLELERS